jgi:hypothetical protein
MLEGVNIQWGKKCIGYDEFDDEVWAIFQDGTRVRGDILIGCDGINSSSILFIYLFIKKRKKNLFSINNFFFLSFFL